MRKFDGFSVIVKRPQVPGIRVFHRRWLLSHHRGDPLYRVRSRWERGVLRHQGGCSPVSGHGRRRRLSGGSPAPTPSRRCRSALAPHWSGALVASGRTAARFQFFMSKRVKFTIHQLNVRPLRRWRNQGRNRVSPASGTMSAATRGTGGADYYAGRFVRP